MGIILILVLLTISTPVGAVEDANPPDTPNAEYLVALIDTTTPSIIKAKIFFALSSSDLSDTANNYETLIFEGLKRENISNCSLTDYVFFDIRFAKQLEKQFHDNSMIESEKENFFQHVDNTGIFLFQQPFLMIHLAFKLPTAMLEWQLSMKEKSPAQDYWARIYSAEQQDIPDDINFESSGEDDSLEISYYLSQQTDLFSSRGVSLLYNESYRNDAERMDIIKRILSGNIIHKNSDRKITFPLTRVFISNNANSSGIRIVPTAGEQLDEASMVNRVNSRAKGIFYSSKALIISSGTNKPNNAVQNYSHFNQSSLAEPFKLEIVETYDKTTCFFNQTSKLNRFTRFIYLARVIMTGLIIWTLFFLFFHRKVLKKFHLWKKIKISMLAYLIYSLIAAIFSFMFGFGFVLGIFAMESGTRRFFTECSTSRLFVYGLLTSFFTALTAFLLS